MSGAKDYPVEVALSVAKGKLLCPFDLVHECYEHLTGGPVWTHEMGYRPFTAMVARDVLRQHPCLADVDTSSVTTENWREWLTAAKASLPATVSLEPIPDYGRTQSPLDTLAKMVGDKPVIVVATP